MSSNRETSTRITRFLMEPFVNEMARGHAPQSSYRLSTCGSSRETSERNTCDSLWEGLRRMYLSELYEHGESRNTGRGEVERYNSDTIQSPRLRNLVEKPRREVRSRWP